MRRLAAILLVVASLLVDVACTSSGVGSVDTVERFDIAGEHGFGLAQADYPSQRIYRITARGDAGGGSFKMVLRLETPGRFQLRGRDPLGRSLWGLDYETGATHVVDYRAAKECHADSSLALGIMGLGELPVADLPALLLGRLPREVAALTPDAEQGESRRVEGREVRLHRTSGGLAGWTLWDRGRPLLWYREQDRERLLSHRGGGQIRWRELRAEALAVALTPLPVPADSVTTGCHELVGVL